MQSFTRRTLASGLGVDDHVGDVRALEPDPLLDLARARVRLVERRRARRARASGTPRGRRRCAGSAARAARSPVASRTIALDDRGAVGLDLARPRVASASGSRCVCTPAISGTAARIAVSSCSAIACASSSGSSPGSLTWSESSVLPSTSTSARLCTSRTLRQRRAQRRERAHAGRVSSQRLDVDDDVGFGSARSTASSTASAAAWPWPTAAPGETPITTSANWRPPAWRMRSRRSSTAGRSPRSHRARPPRLRRRAIHQHVDVHLDQPRGREQHEHADEERRDRVAVRVPAAREEQPDEHGERAGEVAREVERVRRERGAAVAPRRAPRDGRAAEVDREHDADRPRTRTTRRAPCVRVVPTSRSIARTEMKRLDDRRGTPPRASAERCSALP